MRHAPDFGKDSHWSLKSSEINSTELSRSEQYDVTLSLDYYLCEKLLYRGVLVRRHFMYVVSTSTKLT